MRRGHGSRGSSEGGTEGSGRGGGESREARAARASAARAARYAAAQATHSPSRGLGLGVNQWDWGWTGLDWGLESLSGSQDWTGLGTGVWRGKQDWRPRFVSGRQTALT